MLFQKRIQGKEEEKRMGDIHFGIEPKIPLFGNQQANTMYFDPWNTFCSICLYKEFL